MDAVRTTGLTAGSEKWILADCAAGRSRTRQRSRRDAARSRGCCRGAAAADGRWAAARSWARACAQTTDFSVWSPLADADISEARMRLTSRVAVVGATLVAGWFAATAAAADMSAMTVGVGDKASLSTPDRATAFVPVTVVCPQMTQQDSGSVTVNIVQTLGSKSTSGSGSTAIVCDGQAHAYTVAVTTAGGADRWRAGAAQVSASGAAAGYGEPQQICGTSSTGETQCNTWTPYMYPQASTGPSAITLTTPN